ncbi:hypothetical protein OEA41_002508 [Lepraria neglecta]|uniref:Uncharacterized protein n=1 Tax=Lepraria neglecta TaxID=209136 RepID=A0AAE0DMF8_9LECA|nr:hypothetical protein OEA41_002508 [Lepraria neglecta]
MSDDVLDITGTLPRMSNGDTTNTASDLFRAETPTNNEHKPVPADTAPIKQRQRENDDQSSQDMLYKSVRGTKTGHISSNFYKNKAGWKAAKALMG